MPNKTDIAKFGLLVLLFIFLGILLSHANADKNQDLSLGESFRSTTTPTLTYTPTITTTPRSTITFLYNFEPETIPTLYQTPIGNYSFNTYLISPDGQWYYFWTDEQTLQLWEVNNLDNLQQLQFDRPADTSYRPIVEIWSRDGTAFVVSFLGMKSGFSGTPSVVNLIDGIWQITGQIHVLEDNRDYDLEWSLDSQYILCHDFSNYIDDKNGFYIFDRQLNLIYEYQQPIMPESITRDEWELYSFTNYPVRRFLFYSPDYIIVSYRKYTFDLAGPMNFYYLFNLNTDSLIPIAQLPWDYEIQGISPDHQYWLLSNSRLGNYLDPGDTYIYLLEIKTGIITELFHYPTLGIYCHPATDMNTLACGAYINRDEDHLFIWYWDDFSLHDVGNYCWGHWEDAVNGYVLEQDCTLYGSSYLLQP